MTPSERHLSKLCRQLFLSLWSYPDLYIDSGQISCGGEGQQFADLLVVFGNHVIIFSDKNCAFPDTGDIDLDWSRWYKKAIEKSADQIFGAERWIKGWPERLFLDKKCTQRLPVTIPSGDQIVVHRIVVALSVADRCKSYFKSTRGSLMIAPRIAEDEHKLKRKEGGRPFTVGTIRKNNGFVHVLDDVTLQILLSTLDTISDFVRYLEQKELFILSGKFAIAAGEEELLSLYLQTVNVNGQHIFPDFEEDAVAIDEGHWQLFDSSETRKRQRSANEISYSWDQLIEKFLHHHYSGTSLAESDHISDLEVAYRIMASENRTRRRMLATGLIDLILKTPSHQRAVRNIPPQAPDEALYVFLLLPRLSSLSVTDYRATRVNHLKECCIAAKIKFPEAQHIIGIATEHSQGEYGSEDLVYLDAGNWTGELQAFGEQMIRDLQIHGLFLNYTETKSVIKEYPDFDESVYPVRPDFNFKGRNRNQRCFCGSGLKHKRCHGKLR